MVVTRGMSRASLPARNKPSKAKTAGSRSDLQPPTKLKRTKRQRNQSSKGVSWSRKNKASQGKTVEDQTDSESIAESYSQPQFIKHQSNQSSETWEVADLQRIVKKVSSDDEFDTFYPFPRLPMEIRFMIWELATPPCVVKMRAVQHHLPGMWDGQCNLRTAHLYRCRHDLVERVFINPNSRTNVLEVCKDSRAWGIANGHVTINSDYDLPKDSSKWLTRNTEGKIWKGRKLRSTTAGGVFEAMRKWGRTKSLVGLRRDIIRLKNTWYRIGSLNQAFETAMGCNISILVSRLSPTILSQIRYIAVECVELVQGLGLIVRHLPLLKKILIISPGTLNYMREVKRRFKQLRIDNPHWKATIVWLSWRRLGEVQERIGMESLEAILEDLGIAEE